MTNPKKNRLRIRDNHLIIYGLYSKFIDSIKHFDSIQTSYRTLTSTLLLASFAAIGFLFSSQAQSLPINRLWGAITITMMALVLNTILFCVDLRFQERLLFCNFVQLIKLEKKHQWLPQIHTLMMGTNGSKTEFNRKSIFYIGCGICQIVIAGMSLSFIAISPALQAFIFLGTILFILFYAWWLFKLSGNYSELFKQILNGERLNE